MNQRYLPICTSPFGTPAHNRRDLLLPALVPAQQLRCRCASATVSFPSQLAAPGQVQDLLPRSPAWLAGGQHLPVLPGVRCGTMAVLTHRFQPQEQKSPPAVSAASLPKETMHRLLPRPALTIEQSQSSFSWQFAGQWRPDSRNDFRRSRRPLIKPEQHSQVIKRRCLDHDLVHFSCDHHAKVLCRPGPQRSDAHPVQTRRDIKVGGFFVGLLRKTITFQRLNLSRELECCYSVRGHVDRHRIALIKNFLPDAV